MENIVHDKRKIYYTMGEVAEMFDVNPSLIRFWEKKFDILKPQKNKKGNRLFTPRDVDNLKLIYHLVKERGMTLAGAQKRLKGDLKGTARDMEIADRLLAIRAMLVEIREELKEEGELIADDGYLDADEDRVIAGTGTPAGWPAQDHDAAKRAPTTEGDVIELAEGIRTEFVTDGSSPWEAEAPAGEVYEEEASEPAGEAYQYEAGEPEATDTPSHAHGPEKPDMENEGPQEEAEADSPQEETGTDSPQRQAAMQELRDVKNILDGWDTPAGAPDAATTAEHPAGQRFYDDFADDLDADGDDSYPGPWEELPEPDLSQPEGEASAFNAANPAAALPDDHPRPGELFGTDLCTTFSPDDAQAGDAQANEEQQRPRIYEQTLF